MPTNRDWENLIHEISQNTADVIFTKHANEKMAEREITKSMVLATLRNGQIVRPPKHQPNGDVKCRIEYDCGGEEIKVIAALKSITDTRTVIVTTFAKEEDEE